MPFFIKKTEEDSSESVIKELQTEEERAINELPQEQPQARATHDLPKEQIKLTLKEDKRIPMGTITVRILIGNIEFANFTLLPEIFNDAKKLLKETVSKIDGAKLKINSNCDCAWCIEKITELEEFLKAP